MKLDKNVGRIDRSLRLVAAIVLFGAGLFVLGGISGQPNGLLVAGFGFIPLATGLARFCPFYVPLGISTRARMRNAPKCCGLSKP